MGTKKGQYHNLIRNAMIGLLYIEKQDLKGDVRRAIWKISEIGSIKDLEFTKEKR